MNRIINTKKKIKITITAFSIILIAFEFYPVTPILGLTTLNTPNIPPNIPSNPIPTDSLTGVELDINFYWSGGDPDGDIVYYDVYLGLGNSNLSILVSNGQLETSFYPGILSYNSTYYWQIIAVDEHGASSWGPIWSFTTKEEINNIYYCKNLGYFIDTDSDGIFDLFYSNQTGIKTVTEKRQDGYYLINNDMDSDWDFKYNFQTDILSSYFSENVPLKQLDNIVYYLLIIGIVIVVILLIAISLGKKRKKEEDIKENIQQEEIKENGQQDKKEKPAEGKQSEKSEEPEDELKKMRDKIDKL